MGGGAYEVAKKHLGELPSLLVGASLIFDYILTAAVSVSAGVAAITSAFPQFFDYKTAMGIGVIFFLMVMNLRGVRESGKLFTVPPYLFTGSLFIMIGVGAFKYFSGGLSPSASGLVPQEGLGLASAFIVIRAFAAGCTAMTGLEATADGVQSFKPPEAHNANKILIWMAVILSIIFAGISALAYLLHIVPQPGETVISQIGRNIFGEGAFYFLIQSSTALILLLAANTPFAGLPKLSSILAKERYLPRQFFTLGSRLVYANGIIALAILSGILIYAFDANTHSLIPLYAVGVFIGFTLAQWGMVKHWKEQLRLHPEGPYRIKKAISAIGAITTGIVLFIVFISKFSNGAWIVPPSLFLLIVLMRVIHAHYRSVSSQLSLLKNPHPKILPQRTVILLVSGVHQGTIKGLEAAKNIRPAHLKAVHVAIDAEETEVVKKLWKKYGEGVRLDILPSPERNIIEPLINYVERLDKQWRDDTIILVIPEFVPSRPWEHVLHSQTAMQLRWALSHREDVEILDVPYRLKHHSSLNIARVTMYTLKDMLELLWSETYRVGKKAKRTFNRLKNSR